ncbi:MAG TPA: type II secretion system secretin GspD, partial [Parvularculaceae bacterium]|nr:type II secretion system secretin GspD [Parvularculaceae bacterium]
VPVEASNSILIRAEPAMINRLSSVIAELDRIGEAKSDLSVVFLSHANAEELTPLLKEIANSQNGGASAASGDGQNYSTGRQRAAISFHKPTNSIIISGDADIQRTLQNVISKLDIRRKQVQVEAIIVEVSDKTARELGLQYFLSGTEGSSVPFAATNFKSAQTNILSAAGAALLDGQDGAIDGDVLDSDVGKAALSSLLGLNGLALGGGGKTAGGTLFGAILTAIKQDTGSNVLSTPSVVTLDNQKATLSVGQEIPITTGEAVGDNLTNAFRTVSREEVGVILEVTPQINDGGTVTLEISQETSSIAGQIIDTSTDLITNKRLITTTALVDDGDILVIGGLVDETTESFQDAVPLLGDIPGVGNLFKTQGKSKTRRNLMVFIRPTILRDQDTARAATQKKLDYVRAKELLYTGQSKSDLDRLIEQVTGIDGAAPNGSGGNQ